MEMDSGADSVSSTPRSVHHKHPLSDDKSVVRLMLPNEELDALITVSTDEDVENMMEEFDRLSTSATNKIPRLRLFLFPDTNEGGVSRTSSIASLLDGSRKRENWFLDALNGGSTGGGLERGRSEASSIVSEVPDYLFGLESSDEPPQPPAKFRNRSGLAEPNPGSAPGSPAFGSASAAPSMPNLPPVKTKPEKTNMHSVDDGGEPVHVSGPVWSHNVNPSSPYRAHAVQQQPVPVYYVQAPGSGPGMIPSHRNVVPVSVPIQGHQGLSGMNQPVYYGVNNGGMVATYPGTNMPIHGDDDGSKGRTYQS
uniref:PB1 domain-containing protein n=1 Tax=Chenopodium quinoa TaxID=63459 RepID=A0A803LL41_CHEQI